MSENAFSEGGEAWRQMFNIDGTAGDAQDYEHPFVSDSPGGCCTLCGLAKAYRKHTEPL